MFKVVFKSINPSAVPLPYGGTASLIPGYLARGLASEGKTLIDATVSIDTNLPYMGGTTTWDGDDLVLIADWLPDQYGKPVGDEPSPIDLVNALYPATWLEWEILEGNEIIGAEYCLKSL